MIFSGILIWNVYDGIPVQEGMKKSSSRSIKFGMTSNKPKILGMTSNKPKILGMTSNKPKILGMTSSKLVTATPKSLNAKQEEIRDVCAIAYDRIQKDKERNLRKKLNSCNKKANIVGALGGLFKKNGSIDKTANKIGGLFKKNGAVGKTANKVGNLFKKKKTSVQSARKNVDTATDYF